MTTKQHITARNNLHMARKKLLKWQPDALYVRLEGKCPDCKRTGGFVSYQLPGDADEPLRADGNEPCGYVCTFCNWSAAGSRKGSEE